MIPGKFIWKPAIQKLVTGHARRFRLTPRPPAWPEALKMPGFYLHVPFCKNLCPYCPYNRVEYDEQLFESYQSAVMQEIDLYAPHLQGLPCSSLYVGGGTPTVNWLGLVAILIYLRERLAVECDICVELHPANMDIDCLKALKDVGVTQLSIGVESTSDEVLRRIGRSHNALTAVEAVERALQMDFRSVNVDLMFALPGQSLTDWQIDVSTVVDLGINQLSTYPMFSFPYSELGKSNGIPRVARPAHHRVKAMLDFTDGYCGMMGLKRCAVWSWLRPGTKKFSSITRHHYVGFGPSAASMTGRDFYVNTFNVEQYAECLPAKRPVSVSMPVDRRTEMAYWLYWRIYELKIKDCDFHAVFGEESSLEQEFGNLLKPLTLIGLFKRVEGGYHVTRAGAYWIHRLQNEYSLSYINHLWGTCRREPWPSEVRL